jgi:hypothetical protein
MEESASARPTGKASKLKTFLFIIVVLIAIAGAVLIVRDLSDNKVLNGPNEPATSQPQKSNSATDPRIQQNAPTGATEPSPSATGPGSNNSIVGQ